MPEPPITITPSILELTASIHRELGKLEGLGGTTPQPQLRRSNRIRTIHGTLAIEGNTLSLDQVTDVLDGVHVVGPTQDIREVRNANRVYANLARWRPNSSVSLLQAHAAMMDGLIEDPGQWRTGDVGVLRGSRVAHVAPPAHRVPDLMKDLFTFLRRVRDLPWLIRAGVFHYELEFIHPFSDGNGRMGRLWQQVVCAAHEPVFEHLPVESLVREHQADYYAVLSECDHAGESTRFVEFMLDLVARSLAELVATIRPVPSSAATRLTRALDHFGDREFSRKDYMALFRTISSATASRDLRTAVEQGAVTRTGNRATTRYRRS